MVDTLKIRTYVVWIPMLDVDEGSEVPYASRSVGTSPQYFDGGKLVGDGLARSGGIRETVWDAFLFYPPGPTWGPEGLPFPEIAIAQVGGVVLGTKDALPAVADQSRLLPEWSPRMAVVGDQKHIEDLLETVARKVYK